MVCIWLGLGWIVGLCTLNISPGGEENILSGGEDMEQLELGEVWSYGDM